MDFGAYHLGSYSKTLKSVLLKGSEKCLEDAFSLIRFAHIAKLLKNRTFLIKKKRERERLKNCQNPESLPSLFFTLTIVIVTYSHQFIRAAILGESATQGYFCNDPDFQVNLDLYQCNELQQVKANTLSEINLV